MSQPDFPGRTRASKERSDSEGPPEPHRTRRTPGRQEDCGCASACDRLCRARDATAPPHTHLRRPPAHENTHDRLSTPRAEYTKLGAWGRMERVANEAPARTCRVDGSRATRCAPLRGPRTVALPDHRPGHWPPGRVTCCSQARPQPLITWHRARSGTESGLHAQGERGH